MINIKQENKDFEAVYIQHCKPIEKPDLWHRLDGIYRRISIQDNWIFWQASKELQDFWRSHDPMPSDYDRNFVFDA
jgi:hypothetical protein